MLNLPRFGRHSISHESAIGVCHGQTQAADVHDGVQGAGSSPLTRALPAGRAAILQWRAAQQRRTLAQRIRYSRAAAMQGTPGALTGDLSVPRGLAESQRC